MSLELAFGALLVELVVGYPDRFVQTIGHPVIWIGGLIDRLENHLNRSGRSDRARRAAGLFTIAIVLTVSIAVAVILEGASRLGSVVGFAALAVVASTLLAQRSLHRYVTDVADALEFGGIEAGRRAVSQIVGRDPDALDTHGVARAAIESLAENFSDGIVAPAFWIAAAGLAGGAAYKAINTADSMIGHRTARYAAFGWAAARFDDLVNLTASRLSASLLIGAAATLSEASASDAWRAVRRDARRHRSPNAGYPEAAMAGALGLALAGPRAYGGIVVDDATMGDGRRAATADDIRMALRLYRRADALLILLLAIAVCLIGRG